MSEMAESVKQYGVLSPAIARPLPEGGYELVSGHRRKRACELAGLETMPVIVRELDDDAAAILVVDSNLQREDLLPSERAFAYKLTTTPAIRSATARGRTMTSPATGGQRAAPPAASALTSMATTPTRTAMASATAAPRS